MLNYLMSVLIFYIILKASVLIGKVFLNSKGRLERLKALNQNNEKASIFLTACIPIFRLIVVITMYYICFCNEKNFEEIIKED